MSIYTQRQQLFNGLMHFADRMQQQQPKITDGCLTSRVVGEFSAGKTRFLCELLSDQLPEALYPVSSMQAETRLALEITHGEQVGLELIEKSSDGHTADNRVLQSFEHFPSRAEVMNSDPFLHRLRLTLPEPRFILANGDGYSDEETPMRLFLVDTPGWNSGEDEISEQTAEALMFGEWNLNVVYVCHALRLDSQLNQDKLKDFLRALADKAFDFRVNPHLIMMVTHCSAAERDKSVAKMQQRVYHDWAQIAEEMGVSDDSLTLELDVLAYDFADFVQGDCALRGEFRQRFWQAFGRHLQQPKQIEQHPWLATLHTWPEAWQVQPLIQAQIAQLSQLRQLTDQAKQDGEWVKNMNMARLIGLDAVAVSTRLSERWYGQVQLHSDFKLVPCRDLPKDHPLSVWWRDYWQPRVTALIDAHQQLLEQVPQAFAQLPSNTPDLNAYLCQRLDAALKYAQNSQQGAFLCVLNALNGINSQAVNDAPSWLATLLQLSLLDASYQDHLHSALNSTVSQVA